MVGGTLWAEIFAAPQEDRFGNGGCATIKLDVRARLGGYAEYPDVQLLKPAIELLLFGSCYSITAAVAVTVCCDP